MGGERLGSGIEERRRAPERCLTVRYVLALPGDHVEHMEDSVVAPVVVKDAVEDGLGRKR